MGNNTNLTIAVTAHIPHYLSVSPPLNLQGKAQLFFLNFHSHFLIEKAVWWYRGAGVVKATAEGKLQITLNVSLEAVSGFFKIVKLTPFRSGPNTQEEKV